MGRLSEIYRLFFQIILLYFLEGLGNLEQLELRAQNLQDTFATANFSFLPKMKALKLSDCNLTEFNIQPASVIANLEVLSLHSNPLLNINALIPKLPNTLVELGIDLNENHNATYFQHLTGLKTLTIFPKVDLEYHAFSRLQSLDRLIVIYKTPASQALNITLEDCPVSLSYVDLDIELGDVEYKLQEEYFVRLFFS